MGQIKYNWHNIVEEVTIGGKTYTYKSKIERKWATYLEMLKQLGAIEDWDYEPYQFVFKERFRRRRVYIPDFRVIEKTHGLRQRIYHEVKTYLRQPDILKFKYMQADYPSETMVLILPCGTKSVKKIIMRDKAKKYIQRIVYCNPIFRKYNIT